MKSTKVLVFVSNDFMNDGPILEGLYRESHFRPIGDEQHAHGRWRLGGWVRPIEYDGGMIQNVMSKNALGLVAAQVATLEDMP